MNWRKVRLFGLIGLIGGAGAMLAILAFFHQWIWFAVFSVISIAVIGGEIYSYFFTPQHITISTRYGLWIKSNPFWALLALGLFIFAMLSLAVHLIGYAF